MTPYKNAGGSSGVAAYELEPGAITVRFADGAIYRYSEASAGAAAIAEMRARAERGEGLNSYINQHVRDRYERQVRGPQASRRQRRPVRKRWV